MQVSNILYQIDMKKQAIQLDTLKNNCNTANNKNINLNKSPLAVYNVAFQGIRLHKIPNKLEIFGGCLLGGAIGDAFGANIEFLNLNQIKEQYGESGAQFKKLKNDENIKKITDDTQMTLYTADGLIKSFIKQGNINDIDFACIYDSYLDWMRAQEQRPIKGHGWINSLSSMKDIMAPGNTCTMALLFKNPGTLSNQINDSKGNGGIMRIAPVGLLYHKTPELAFDIGVGCTALTHSDPDAYLSAGACASLIAYLVNGEGLENAIDKTLGILKTKENNKDVIKKIKEAIELTKSNLLPEEAISQIGKGKIGSEALGISIYCSLKYPKDIIKGIEIAANYSGDSDTVAAITGNIIGANIGLPNIPEEIKQINDKDSILHLTKDLYNLNYNKVCDLKYPLRYETDSISLEQMLSLPDKDVKEVDKDLMNKVLNVNESDIIDFKSFLENKNIPINLVEKILIPIDMIKDEISNTKAFNKLIHSISNNYEHLLENENNRGCWADEKCTIDELMWSIYGIVVDCNNADKYYTIATIMIEDGKYTIEKIISILESAKTKSSDELDEIIESLYIKN